MNTLETRVAILEEQYENLAEDYRDLMNKVIKHMELEQEDREVFLTKLSSIEQAVVENRHNYELDKRSVKTTMWLVGILFTVAVAIMKFL